MCVSYQGVRNVCFFRKFGLHCFLVTSVLRFAFLLYYRRFVDDICILLTVIMPNFLKQRLFITPWYAHSCAYQGIINNRFCRKSQESFCFQVLIKYSSERTNALIFRRQEWFWVSGFGNCTYISSWNLESKEFYFKYLCGFWKAHMAQLLLFKKIQSMQKMLGKKYSLEAVLFVKRIWLLASWTSEICVWDRYLLQGIKAVFFY